MGIDSETGAQKNWSMMKFDTVVVLLVCEVHAAFAKVRITVDSTHSSVRLEHLALVLVQFGKKVASQELVAAGDNAVSAYICF